MGVLRNVIERFLPAALVAATATVTLVLAYGDTAALDAPLADGLHNFCAIASVYETGVFGISCPVDTDGAGVTPSNFREPMVAWLSAPVMGVLDATVGAPENYAACAADQHSCAAFFGTLRASLGLVHIAGALAVFALAQRVLASKTAASVAGCLFATNYMMARSALIFLTEPLAAVWVALAAVAIVSALWPDLGRRDAVRLKRRPWLAATVAGASLGALALTKGAFVILPFALLAAAAAAATMSRWRPRALKLALCGSVALAIIAPWVARNAVVLESPAVTARGDAVLALRAELNRTPAESWPLALVIYTPILNRTALADDPAADQYNPLEPESAYRRLVESRTAAHGLAGDTGDSLSRAAARLIAQDPLAHAAWTGIVLYRSVFLQAGLAHIEPLDDIASVLEAALIGMNALLLPLALPSTVLAMVLSWRESPPHVMVLCLGSLTMIAAFALGTQYLPRFNLPLLPVFCLAVCYCGMKIAHRVQAARRPASG